MVAPHKCRSNHNPLTDCTGKWLNSTEIAEHSAGLMETYDPRDTAG